jgi:hypothetical protein
LTRLVEDSWPATFAGWNHLCPSLSAGSIPLPFAPTLLEFGYWRVQI